MAKNPCHQRDHTLDGNSLASLSEVSPRDEGFKKYKIAALKAVISLLKKDYHKYSERMRDCAESLCFGLKLNSAGEYVLKLVSARFCRVRVCPICQWRKSLMWRARFYNALPRILRDYPTYRYLFLTLTVRNPPMDELKSTVTLMNKAWRKITKRKSFPAVGWLKSLEITKGRDGNPHPHFHVVLMVRSGYFKSENYLSKEAWCKMWKSSLGIDYSPQVNIKAVRSKMGDSEDSIAKYTNEIKKALCYTLKYSTKDERIITEPDWLDGMIQQLHRTRMFALGGIFKNYLSSEDPENLIKSDGSPDELLPNEDKFWCYWFESIKDYQFS